MHDDYYDNLPKVQTKEHTLINCPYCKWHWHFVLSHEIIWLNQDCVPTNNIGGWRKYFREFWRELFLTIPTMNAKTFIEQVMKADSRNKVLYTLVCEWEKLK